MEVPLVSNHTHQLVTCITQLESRIHIPSIQRNVDPARVAAITEYITKSVENGQAPVLGVISLVILGDKIYVVDGQHRLEALRAYHASSTRMVPFHTLQYLAATPDALREIFMLINSGEPVPTWVLTASADRITFDKECEAYLSQFNPLFNSNSNRPAANITAFMNAYKKSKHYPRIKKMEDFTRLLNFFNTTLAAKCQDSAFRKAIGVASNYTSTRWWSTMVATGFYLGIDKDFSYLELDM